MHKYSNKCCLTVGTMHLEDMSLKNVRITGEGM